jgi:hypothetical protein
VDSSSDHTEDQTPTLTPIEAEHDYEVALAARTDLAVLDRLTGIERAAEIFARRVDLIAACHRAALRATRPQDWVLSRDRHGTETAMLCASGADIVAQIYGVVVTNMRPVDARGIFEPDRLARSNGSFGYRAWCDATSRVTGGAVEALECVRWSDEDFTGRATDARGEIVATRGAALDSDLRASVYRLARTKAVRVLCAMTRLPVSELSAAWSGTDRSLEQCRRGHGYGSSAERAAAAVSDAGIESRRDELRAAVLSVVGGDANAARAMLREVTAGKDFAGFESVDRMTKIWQIENALLRLRGRTPKPDTSGSAS